MIKLYIFYGSQSKIFRTLVVIVMSRYLSHQFYDERSISCSDPKQRPAFSSIVATLKKLLKSPVQLLQMGGT